MSGLHNSPRFACLAALGCLLLAGRVRVPFKPSATVSQTSAGPVEVVTLVAPSTDWSET